MNKPIKPIKRKTPPLEYIDYYRDGIPMSPSELEILLCSVLNFVGADHGDICVWRDYNNHSDVRSEVRFSLKNPNYEQELSEYNKRDEVYAAELEQYEKDMVEYKKFVAEEKVKKLQEQLKQAQEQLKEFES